MKRRFMGKAKSTPRMERTMFQRMIWCHARRRPSTSMYATSEEMSGLVMYPALVAMD